MTAPIVPGNRPLSPLQRAGLTWIGRWSGRDVVLAIDLTESVGLNDAGRLHLRQIVEKTLTKGDTLHVIPFATTVHTPAVFAYQGVADIPRILATVPMNAGPEQGTDIQCAELYIYRYLAAQNQQRLRQGQPIKAQSVIWLTDAPIHLPQGQSWVEAPESPCGRAGSPQATERTRWLEALPMTQRQVQPGQFQLTVVDMPATVQEFCTPKPGGGEVCLVNDYLWRQLGWQLVWAGVLGLAALGGGLWWLVRWFRQQMPWRLSVQVGDRHYAFALKHGQRVGLGGAVAGSFQCVFLPSLEAVGYLERCHQNLKIRAFNDALLYNGQPIMGTVTVPYHQHNLSLSYKDETIRMTW